MRKGKFARHNDQCPIAVSINGEWLLFEKKPEEKLPEGFNIIAYSEKDRHYRAARLRQKSNGTFICITDNAHYFRVRENTQKANCCFVEDAFDRLVGAILEQAIRDLEVCYIDRYIDPHKRHNLHFSPFSFAELKNFFGSQWFDYLYGHEGTQVFERLFEKFENGYKYIGRGVAKK